MLAQILAYKILLSLTHFAPALSIFNVRDSVIGHFPQLFRFRVQDMGELPTKDRVMSLEQDDSVVLMDFI